MPQYDAPAEELDEHEEEVGWLQRFINRVRPADEDEEEYEEPVAVNENGARSYRTARRDTFRIASARESSITVMPVASFGDIQRVADRLKSGEAQIINLEKTPTEVSERLIDFLNGVTYALDGAVEKIAENAYLFTPSHVKIHMDGPEPAQPKSPFFHSR